MPIPPEEICRVAALANPKLNQQEITRFSNDPSHILYYIDQLKDLDTEAIAPLISVFEREGSSQRDEVGWCLCAENVLQNAPDRKGNFFKVPKVIE